MRRRGGGLAVVLLITAILMVVAFALATSAVSHLHMARGFLESTRSRLLAEAAASSFLADLQAASKEARERGMDVENLEPTDLGLRTRWTGDVPLGGLSQGERVDVHFDGRDFYSTDNSVGEFAAAGWLDRGTDRKSVPAFAVELILSVQVGSGTRRYRAIVTRRWPYAAFSNQGAAVLSATALGPAGDARAVLPTLVEGPIATLVETLPPSAYNVSPLTVPLKPPGAAETLPERLARLASWEWSQCRVPAQAPCTIGPTMAYVPPVGAAPQGLLVQGGLRCYVVNPPDPGVPTFLQVGNPGNVLSGDVDLAALASGVEDDRVRVGAGSTFDGTAWRGRLPADLTPEHNPVRDVRVPSGDVPGFRRVELPLVASLPTLPGNFRFVRGDVRLEPDLVEGADAPGSGSRFYLDGDLGNRFVTPLGTGYQVYESSGTLRLRNALLFVNGNVDLSASEGGTAGIEGTNATLVVNGTLALGAGHLDSRDQGMVIWARNVILRARGEYRGLIIARDSLAIMPAGAEPTEEDVLRIRGAVLCEGPLVLRSTRLTYDAAYMKSLHAYGRPVVTEWSEL